MSKFTQNSEYCKFNYYLVLYCDKYTLSSVLKTYYFVAVSTLRQLS